ncbi:MAG: aldo/keto reductase [Chloroflexi bacterium]|nr:MAG: aldo/keto reductase [Chloroflexota bacterium]
MRYRQIPALEKPISRLIHGTVYVSSDALDAAYEIFDRLFEAGCNAFDTAENYGRGESERVLGQWLASRGVRDEVVIITKGAHPYDGQQRVTPEHITADLAGSLERLGVDSVDLYLLHRDDPSYPVGPIVDVLNDHHKAGRIRAFGGSNWSYERIAQANEYARANGLTPFTISSPQFSLAEMINEPWEGCISIGGEANKAARAWYATHDVALFAWSSIAGGFMSGRFRRDNLDTFTDYFDRITVNTYCHDDNFRRLERAELLAVKKGISTAQLGLAYVLNHPLEMFALVGSRSLAEVESNLAAIDVHLTPDEMTWLDLQHDNPPF